MSTYKIMCVNAGSSSLKFKLYEMDAKASDAKTLREKAKYLQVLTSGIVERIGHEDAIFTLKKPDGFKNTEVLPVKNHDEAVQLLLNGLIKFGIVKDLKEINGVGNRVVQGGKYFSDSHIFDQYTYDRIEELIPLDPLHAEAHLTCFNAFKKATAKKSVKSRSLTQRSTRAWSRENSCMLSLMNTTKNTLLEDMVRMVHLINIFLKLLLKITSMAKSILTLSLYILALVPLAPQSRMESASPLPWVSPRLPVL